MRSQTAIFSKLVGDFMRRDPLAVPVGTPVSEAVALMTKGKRRCAVVVDAANRPVGLLTEQDVTRRVAFRLAPSAPVEEAMATPAVTIPEDAYLFHAIARMRRRELRHLPVVDAEGVLGGILDLHDAMAVAADRLLSQIDRLSGDNSIAGLKAIKDAQVRIAEELMADNLPAPEVQQFLTRVNIDIYRRVVDACLADMEAEGWGAAPVDFAVIVMGSGGRGENYLFPDQDNGFVLADYPDEQHGRIDRFFIELAERVCRDLDQVGIPYCNGYCMAMNPLWRKTLSQWLDQIAMWGRKKNFVAIRLSDIFFDFVPVWGNEGFAKGLRAAVTRMVTTNHFLLQQMYHEEKDHNVALGFFGQIVTEGGVVNLKLWGTIPLVEAVRLLALREGIERTSTLGRIEELLKKEVFDPNEAEGLAIAYRVITEILLEKQIEDYQAGRKVTYEVDPEALNKTQTRALKDALRETDTLRKRIRAEFTGDVF